MVLVAPGGLRGTRRAVGVTHLLHLPPYEGLHTFTPPGKWGPLVWSGTDIGACDLCWWGS